MSLRDEEISRIADDWHRERERNERVAGFIEGVLAAVFAYLAWDAWPAVDDRSGDLFGALLCWAGVAWFAWSAFHVRRAPRWWREHADAKRRRQP